MYEYNCDNIAYIYNEHTSDSENCDILKTKF